MVPATAPATAPGPAVRVTYYTDPLCSWSWAFEPVWRRLRYEFGPRLAWQYRLGGLIPDWATYRDPLNDVASPAHMGPRWIEVSRSSGMPIDSRVWCEDPPGSSYPACVAVKAAELQGPAAGERYLRRVREAVMLERRNVARRDVLVALAHELAQAPLAQEADGAAPDASFDAAFDAGEFLRALDDGRALDAFRDDLRDATYRGIGRFPTLVLRPAAGAAESVIIVGYRPYAAVRKALAHVAPQLAPLRDPPTPAAYAARWGRERLTPGELALACAGPGD